MGVSDAPLAQALGPTCIVIRGRCWVHPSRTLEAVEKTLIYCPVSNGHQVSVCSERCSDNPINQVNQGFVKGGGLRAILFPSYEAGEVPVLAVMSSVKISCRSQTDRYVEAAICKGNTAGLYAVSR
jgi:hypothetical protein